MKSIVTLSCLLCSINASLADDEADIRKLFKVRSTAWNDKDVKALTAPFADDIDYISSSGTHYRGKKKLNQFYNELLSSEVYKHSKASQKILSVQIIRPGIAVVDSDWVLSNIHLTDGNKSSSRSGKTVVVLSKDSGEWKIIAIRPHVIAAE